MATIVQRVVTRFRVAARAAGYYGWDPPDYPDPLEPPEDDWKWTVATKFSAKSGRTKHLEGKPGHTLCGEEAHKDTLVDSVKDSTCHYCVQAWEKKH